MAPDGDTFQIFDSVYGSISRSYQCVRNGRGERLAIGWQSVSQTAQFGIFSIYGDPDGGNSQETRYYRWARSTGALVAVSQAADGTFLNVDRSFQEPPVSADGKTVPFIVYDQSTFENNLWIWREGEGATAKTPATVNGVEIKDVSSLALTANGNFVFFAGTLYDPNTGVRIGALIRFDRISGAFSILLSGETTYPEWLSVSDDGMLLAFQSYYPFVPEDTNELVDVYVLDTTTLTLQRASVDSIGNQANGYSSYPQITGNGQFVVFQSDATNLVTFDFNGATDVFRHDLRTGVTKKLSILNDGSSFPYGASLVNYSGPLSQVTSTNGSRVVFVDGGSKSTIVWDENGVVPTAPPPPSPEPGLSGGKLTHLQDFTLGSRASSIVQVFPDSRYVHATGYGPYPVFIPYDAIQDATTGEFEYVDVSSGSPVTLPVTDANRVVILATVRDLVPTDTNNKVDIYKRDRQLNLTTKLSQAFDGSQTLGDVGEIAVSDGGLWVAFVSSDLSLLPGLNGHQQVFLMDVTTRELTLLSKTFAGLASIGYNSEPRISADGRYVAFVSDDTTLTLDDDNPGQDVFRYDRISDTLERVTINGAGMNLDDLYSVASPAISGDGTVVAFSTIATNVVPGEDPNAIPLDGSPVRPQNAHLQRVGGTDVFLFDFKTGELEVGDVDNLGERPQRDYLGSYYPYSSHPSLNFDGSRLAFDSNAGDLVIYAGGNSGIFLRDRTKGKTYIASYNTGFYNSGYSPKIAPTGDRIFFLEGTSQASDDVFVRDISAPVITSPLTASATVGLPFTYQVTASNSPQSYTATNLPAGLTFDAGSALISGTPTQVGSKNVTLTASTAGGTGSATLTITVALATVPVITSPLSANATVGQPFSYQITASGNPTSYDATGLPAGVTVNKTTGLISGTPSAAGDFSVNLSATNASGTGTATLTLTISATSSAPVITSPGAADGIVAQPFSYQITATNTPTSFGASGLPAGLTINTGTGLISGTSSVAGGFSVNLSASNSSGTGSAVLTLTISPAAASPVITSPTSADATMGELFTYQIVATGSPSSYNATALPAGVVVNTSTGLLSGSPSVAGTFLVGLSATNASGTGTATLTLEVAATASKPVIISPLSASATVGQSFTYQLVATHFPTSYTATNLPAGLTFDSTLRAITGTPTQAGTKQVALSATNSSGTGTATLALTVNALPGPDEISIINGTSETGRTGQPFTFQVEATGVTSEATVTATGLPPGLSLDGATGLITGTATQDGSYLIVVTVHDSDRTATATLQLTFVSDPAFPVITSASSVTLIIGQPFSYTITAPGSGDPSDPTIFRIVGELPAGLTFNAATGTISGTYTGPTRKYLSGGVIVGLSIPSAAIIADVQLFATNSHGTGTQTLTFFRPVPQLSNISTRLNVGTGDNVLIGGFIVTGNAPKKVILRAIGPALAAFGLDALADPVLELHMPDMTVVTNDNWKETQQTEIEATGLQPSEDLESAIVATLAPGAYTAIVKGKDGGTGVGLVEAYDLDEAADSTMANISTRGFVDTGDNVMIGGVIIGGGDSQVLVRAIGPALIPFGITDALEDPVLELHDKDGALITENDNWRDLQEADIEATKLAPTDDRESAILATLAPDSYTAIVRGKNDTTGVALVEVYNVSR